MRKTTLLDIKKEDLVHLYHEKNLNISQISKKYNVAPTTITNHFKRHNIPREREVDLNALDVLKQELHRLFHVDRMTYDSLASHYGVSVAIIRRRLKEYNITTTRETAGRSRGNTKDLETLKDGLETAVNLEKLNIEDIANRYGIVTSTAHRWLREFNITRNDAPVTEVITPPDGFVEYVIRTKDSTRKLTKKYKKPAATIRKWLDTDPRTTKMNLKPVMLDKKTLERLHHTEQKTLKHIAEDYNTTPYMIKRALGKHDIEQYRYGKMVEMLDEQTLRDMHIEKKMSMVKIGDRIGVSPITVAKWFKLLNIETYEYPCPKTSKPEMEILDYVRTFDPDAKKIKYGRKELDIVSEKYGLAIEYCGGIWHSERYSPKARTKHHAKMVMAEDKGLHLLTIWDAEWEQKPEVIKSMIAHKCGQSGSRLYARKLTIKDVSVKESNIFYQDNHMRGRTTRYVSSKGLYDGKRLVACMSLTRHPRNNTVVLGRFACIMGLSVVGGFSKLFKKISKGHERIITWSDNRWSDRNVNVYLSNGFVNDGELKSDYSYARGGMIYSKQSRQKKRIDCPPNQTEREYNYNLGYYRLWDCGKTRWLWEAN